MKKGFLRIAALALTAILALGVFAACNNGDGATDSNDDSSKVNIYAIKAGGVTVELGKKADSTLSKLGEPISEQNTGNCGGLGETVRYDYSSFVLVVVEYTDGDKIIDEIELKNDSAETTKGIYIGSTEADVKDAYGEPDETKDRALIYTDGEKRLELGITDGAVSSIVLRCK